MLGNMPGGLVGEEGLAVAIVWRAIADLRSGDPRLQRDAERFFSGSWYVDLCDFLSVPPDALPAALELEAGREHGY